MPRPMPLKNQSIAVIRAFAPEAVLGPEIVGTRKGTVAHVRPPRHSVDLDMQPALARWLVFPRWQAGAALQFEELPSAEAFMRLATNAFNYEMHGEAAFAKRARCGSSGAMLAHSCIRNWTRLWTH